MPYSYHKQGDKYVVTKKDTGKVVGHTKGTKEALNKYLAALHINANENKTMKKSELTKMIQEVIKEVLSERSTKKITEANDMFATGGSINPELRKKVEQFVKGVAKYYDYSVDDAFLAIMTILKGGIAKEGVNEGTFEGNSIAVYDGENGLTQIYKRGNGYYGINDDFDFHFESKAELEMMLKKWRYRLIAGGLKENKIESVNKEELVNEDIKEVLSERSTKKITEAYVPNNIKDFAKRKGASSLVNKVATWAEKCGKGIRGGTAIGKNYSTLVLDLGYQDGAIRINLDDQTVDLYGEEVFDVKSFKMALDNNANEIEEAAPAKAKDLGLSDKGYWRFEFPKDKQGKSTRETAIRDIKSTLDKDQKTYPELKIDIMPSPKEDSVAVIKLIGTGAHKVGTKVKKDYRDLAGFKGAVITKYTPKFTSSGIAPKP